MILTLPQIEQPTFTKPDPRWRALYGRTYTPPKTLADCKRIYKAHGFASLIGVGTNPKTAKSDEKGEYLTAILYLAPASLSGYNTCPKASPGCIEGCLHTSGNPVYLPNKTKARVGRTRMYFENRELFIQCLIIELAAHIRRAQRQGLKPCVRLNGTSDIVWEIIAPQIFTIFKECQFYDYTKIDDRCRTSWTLPANYDLTLSWAEDNHDRVHAVVADNPDCKVAVVFKNVGTQKRPNFPATFLGRPVKNADGDDMRFKDPKGGIAGLFAKGDARHDTSGFVVDGSNAS